jgi:hypothetical protein
MENRTRGSSNEGVIDLGLALWLSAAPMLAWLMLWFLSGDFLVSLLAVVAPLALLAAPLR